MVKEKEIKISSSDFDLRLESRCKQCGTDIVTCRRCRKLHCYHHYCPETDGYNQPSAEVWSEKVNQEEISKTNKFIEWRNNARPIE